MGDTEDEYMKVEQQDQEEQNSPDKSKIEAEVNKKDESPQVEVDNMNKLNISPEETEDNTSSNQSASVTAIEVKPDPPTLINVTLMDVDISRKQWRQNLWNQTKQTWKDLNRTKN